jgi:hypothetical protein
MSSRALGAATLVGGPDVDAILAGWDALRRPMLRTMPDAFTRDEWAYLVGFLDPDALRGLVENAAGGGVLRPRGEVALWLPNNVSLLGPLMLVLVSLSGNPLRMKGGSRGDNLTGVFLDFALAQATGPLRAWLAARVRYDAFDRDDPRAAEMAAGSRVQVFFGSDEAARAVMSLPRPIGSVWLPFTDRRSEAWIEPAAATDDTLATLLRVFAIYGQAGCTSPRRVVLLDAAPADAVALRDRLLALWPRVLPRRPAMHVASANVMAAQWAAGLGWDAARAGGNAAVLAAGTLELPTFDAPMALPVVAASRAAAAAALPANIQTIGHAVADPRDPAWLELLATTAITRFVRLGRMHHFGAIWDGYELLRALFEHVEVEAGA